MVTDTPQDIINSLDDLLEKERAALLEGNLDVITRLLDEKESLIDRLNGCTPTEQDALDNLRGKVTRNQALLDGALQGIRAVANRMSTLRRIRKSLDTYDEKGRKTTIHALRENKVEKRA